MTHTRESISTPTPWVADGARISFPGRAGFKGVPYRVADAYSSSAGLANTPRHYEAVANAAFIVLACNAHEKLVEALKGMLIFYGMDEQRGEVSGHIHDLARAALSLCTQEKRK